MFACSAQCALSLPLLFFRNFTSQRFPQLYPSVLPSRPPLTSSTSLHPVPSFLQYRAVLRPPLLIPPARPFPCWLVHWMGFPSPALVFMAPRGYSIVMGPTPGEGGPSLLLAGATPR